MAPGPSYSEGILDSWIMPTTLGPEMRHCSFSSLVVMSSGPNDVSCPIEPIIWKISSIDGMRVRLWRVVGACISNNLLVSSWYVPSKYISLKYSTDNYLSWLSCSVHVSFSHCRVVIRFFAHFNVTTIWKNFILLSPTIAYLNFDLWCHLISLSTSTFSHSTQSLASHAWFLSCGCIHCISYNSFLNSRNLFSGRDCVMAYFLNPISRMWCRIF
jgi:hypothetical protein